MPKYEMAVILDGETNAVEKAMDAFDFECSSREIEIIEVTQKELEG